MTNRAYELTGYVWAGAVLNPEQLDQIEAGGRAGAGPIRRVAADGDGFRELLPEDEEDGRGMVRNATPPTDPTAFTVGRVSLLVVAHVAREYQRIRASGRSRPEQLVHPFGLPGLARAAGVDPADEHLLPAALDAIAGYRGADRESPPSLSWWTPDDGTLRIQVFEGLMGPPAKPAERPWEVT